MNEENMSGKKRYRLRRFITGGIAFIVVAYIIFTVGYNIGFNSGLPTVPHVMAATLNQDPTLVADAQQLGINTGALNLEFVSGFSSTEGDLTDTSATIGAFIAPNTIQVKSGISKKDEMISVAYEYMHYVWSNFKPETKSSLAAGYDRLYSDDSDFATEIAPFMALKSNTADTIQNEENSIACTHLDPNSLTNEFNAYCNTYIPNRSLLFKL